MASLSYMGLETPTFPKEVSEFPISDRPTKSRFRSLFSKKKPEKDSKTTPTAPETPKELSAPPPPPLPKSESRETRPHQFSRARSTTWTSRALKSTSRSVKHQRPRALTAWDPPPLFQATTQGVLQDVLEIPSSLSDLVFRNGQLVRSSGSSNASSGTSPTLAQTPDQSDSTQSNATGTDRKHERNWSGSSTCSLTQKLFILVDRGYILQYSSEGRPDRLPERILELGPRSVAIASDALPGKHWVLRVSQDGKDDHLQTQTPKTSWTRLPFRSTEVKRLVKDFLLVFDSARAFDYWLTAVRKEIEALGGLEYRPDSRGPEVDGTRRFYRSIRSSKSMPGPLSASSPDLNTTLLERPQTKSGLQPAPESPKLLPPIASLYQVRKSLATSSIATLTDLERLRQCSFSDSNSLSTATRTSFEDSATSGSPAQDSFPNAVAQTKLAPLPTAASSADKTVQRNKTSSVYSNSREDSVKSPTPDATGFWSFKFPRTPTLPTERLHTLLATPPQPEADSPVFIVAKSPPRNVTSTTSSDSTIHALPLAGLQISDFDPSNSRPMSTITPLVNVDAPKKIDSRNRRENAALPSKVTIPPTDLPSPKSSNNLDKRQATDLLGPKRRASYSLFPRRGSSLEYSLQLLTTPLPTPPATGRAAAMESLVSAVAGYPFPSSMPQTAASRNVEPSQTNPSAVNDTSLSMSADRPALANDGKPIVKQLPSTSEAKSANCLGPPNPIQDSSGNTRDCTITTTTIELPGEAFTTIHHAPVPKLSQPPRRDRQLYSQKSMPSLLYSAVPPLGPPPSGPLPAVPIISPTSKSNASTLKANHGRGKSSVSSKNSQPSPTGINSHAKHGRGASCVSSTGSFSSSIIASAPASPARNRRTRKLSSVSSVGSLGSVSGWISQSSHASGPRTNVKYPSRLGSLPGPGPIPTTGPTPQSGNHRPAVAQTHRLSAQEGDITLVSPGTAY